MPREAQPRSSQKPLRGLNVDVVRGGLNGQGLCLGALARRCHSKRVEFWEELFCRVKCGYNLETPTSKHVLVCR